MPDITRFQKIEDLTAAHDALLSMREAGETDALWVEVGAFLAKAKASGAMLDASQDRRAAQSILNYWSSALYRAGLPSEDLTLDEFDPALAPYLPDQPCPYRGLEAFTTDDFYFGRENVVNDLIDRLKRGDAFLTIIGPSGSGKSSVVMGGLLPKLRAGVLQDSAQWHILILVPGVDPMTRLSSALAEVDGATSGRNVIVVDQFEEIFTLCSDAKQREAFANTLITQMNAGDIVVLTLRTDFAEDMAQLAQLHSLLLRGQIDLRAMSIRELREAIEQPAGQVSLKFEEGIVDDLVAKVLGVRAGLPLLQFTLLRLWQNRDHNRITKAVYTKVGTPLEALQRSADALYDGMPQQEKDTTRRVFMKLVRPVDSGTEVTNRRLPIEEIYRGNDSRDRVDTVLQKLTSAGLLRRNDAGSIFEISHESLIRNWPRLGDWLNEVRDLLRSRFLLRDRALAWNADRRDSSWLLRDRELEDAVAYDDLTPLEAEYVQASQNAEQARLEAQQKQRDDLIRAQERAQAERRRRRQIGIFAAITSILLVLSLLASAFAFITLRESRSRQWAAVAINQIERDPERAILLAIEAHKNQPTFETLDALHRTVFASRLQREFLPGFNDAAFSPDGRRTAMINFLGVEVHDSLTDQILWSTQSITTDVKASPEGGPLEPAIAFSPNGKLVLTSGDGPARVLNADDGKVIFELPHGTFTRSAQFSGDGSHIVTTSGPSAVIWDAGTGKRVHEITSTVSLNDAALSADGRYLITAGESDRATVWDTLTGEQSAELIGHGGFIRSVTLSEDNTRLVTTSNDRTAMIWFQTAPGQFQLANVLEGHTGWVTRAAFSREGTQVATVSMDGTVRLWDPDAGRQLAVLQGHTQPPTGVSFSPDNRQLLSTSWVGRRLVWDITLPKEVAVLAGHADGATAVAFSPDGKRVASASRDGTAIIWETATWKNEHVLNGHNAWVNAVAFSLDGKVVATAGSDGTARLWDAQSGRELASLPHGARVLSVAFSPDGKWFVTGDAAGTTRLWNYPDGTLAKTFRTNYSPDSSIFGIAFSPDSSKIATARDDGAIVILDLTQKIDYVYLLPYPRQRASAFEYAASGAQGATVDDTGRLIVLTMTRRPFMLQDMAEMVQFNIAAHRGGAFDVVYSPDGRKIASVGADGAIREWDAVTGKPISDIRGHVRSVNGVAYSPDGRMIASASSDGTVRIWYVNGDDLVKLAQDRVTRALTCEERITYLGVSQCS